MITTSKKISKHFHSSEFRCKCGCGKIKIDENLVYKMENIFSKLNASKCIISSGYRSPDYDIEIGGFLGKHSEGLAADCVYYDKNGKLIPSEIVICVAFDLNELKGIAKVDKYYVHLDNRESGNYRGDETVNNNSVWINPYEYFNISKDDVRKYTNDKSIIELANEVIDGKWGNGNDRKERLTKAGYNYRLVQDKVNELLSKKSVLELANEVIAGKWGNGNDRKNRLTKAGYNYRLVQDKVNELLR